MPEPLRPYRSDRRTRAVGAVGAARAAGADDAADAADAADAGGAELRRRNLRAAKKIEFFSADGSGGEGIVSFRIGSKSLLMRPIAKQFGRNAAQRGLQRRRRIIKKVA